jgi:hypothetical protein
MKDVKNNLIKVCPVCGFSFQAFDSLTRKPVEICPMCGYKFPKRSVTPQKPKEFDKRFL